MDKCESVCGNIRTTIIELPASYGGNRYNMCTKCADAYCNAGMATKIGFSIQGINAAAVYGTLTNTCNHCRTVPASRKVRYRGAGAGELDLCNTCTPQYLASGYDDITPAIQSAYPTPQPCNSWACNKAPATRVITNPQGVSFLTCSQCSVPYVQTSGYTVAALQTTPSSPASQPTANSGHQCGLAGCGKPAVNHINHAIAGTTFYACSNCSNRFMGNTIYTITPIAPPPTFTPNAHSANVGTLNPYGGYNYQIIGGGGSGGTWKVPATPVHVTVKLTNGCECGNAKNPRGQGHSHWCPNFQKEFA
jgi:hypothetical protein